MNGIEKSNEKKIEIQFSSFFIAFALVNYCFMMRFEHFKFKCFVLFQILFVAIAILYSNEISVKEIHPYLLSFLLNLHHS